MRGFANGIIAQKASLVDERPIMSGFANGLIAHCANCLMASYWLIPTDLLSNDCC